MSGYSTLEVWIIILALGVGTFLIRFSFLGVLGDRDLPPWVLRHLRYTAVGILPAMVTPLVLWPHGAEGGLDPQRIAAAAAAMALGLWTKNPIWAVGGGMVMFWCFGWLLG